MAEYKYSFRGAESKESFGWNVAKKKLAKDVHFPAAAFVSFCRERGLELPLTEEQQRRILERSGAEFAPAVNDRSEGAAVLPQEDKSQPEAVPQPQPEPALTDGVQEADICGMTAEQLRSLFEDYPRLKAIITGLVRWHDLPEGKRYELSPNAFDASLRFAIVKESAEFWDSQEIMKDKKYSEQAQPTIEKVKKLIGLNLDLRLKQIRRQ